MEEEVILGYNNFFEKEAVEIEEKIKKLEQVKEMTLVEIRDRIKSDKNYEFWFLINNIYFLLSFEKINLRTVQNFFTEIKNFKIAILRSLIYPIYSSIYQRNQPSCSRVTAKNVHQNYAIKTRISGFSGI